MIQNPPQQSEDDPERQPDDDQQQPDIEVNLAATDDGESDEAGGEMTDVDVDADGFRRPTDHARRQRRAKRKAAMTTPLTDEKAGAEETVC